MLTHLNPCLLWSANVESPLKSSPPPRATSILLTIRFSGIPVCYRPSSSICFKIISAYMFVLSFNCLYKLIRSIEIIILFSILSDPWQGIVATPTWFRWCGDKGISQLLAYTFISIIMFRARGPRAPSQVCVACNCYVSCRKTYVFRYQTSPRNVPVT